ncbi:MAG: hypothetical protein ACJAZP_004171 [Psychromonas sp.]|jgi:hypothetical protein|uniref:hypothetical protein n=1 Tax=Psychromonas sp. TaxID=1884585 RepID=UPI0039E375DD
MSDFIEKINLRGKAEENIYFAKLNQKLVEALREKRAQKANKENVQCNETLTEQRVSDDKQSRR